MCEKWFHVICLGLKRCPPKNKPFNCVLCVINTRFVTIKAEGDGRCFFRSVVISSNANLQTANRDPFGCITDSEMQLQETILADALRQEVVKYMLANIADYSQLGEGINADMPNGRKFTSLMDRINSMLTPTTMAGELEISALANSRKLCIEVYSNTSKPLTYGAKGGAECCLKYTELAPGVGHYDCLVPKC